MPILHGPDAGRSEPGQVRPDQLARIYASQIRRLRDENRALRRQICDLADLIEDLDPIGDVRCRLGWVVA
jgi:hypothetical protein